MNMKIESKWNWNLKSYLIEWIWEVSNIKEWIPYNVFSELWEYLISWWEKHDFWPDLKVGNDFYSPDFLFVEYPGDVNLQTSLTQLNSKFKKVNILSSEKYDNDRQVPEVVWIFQHNWNCYIVLYAYNPLTEEINPEKWVYKWVIVNPGKYFEVENEVKQIEWKIWDIL